MNLTDKRYPAMDDLDVMPWREYKGIPFKDIPADYLSGLFCGLKSAGRFITIDRQKIYNYLHNNSEALQQKYPDFLLCQFSEIPRS